MNILVIRFSRFWATSLMSGPGTLYLIDEGHGDGHGELPADVAARFERIYQVSSFDSIEELSAVAADLTTRGIHIDGIASPTEHTQYAAGYLADALGVRHTSLSTVMATRDKRLMKFKVGQAGVPTARWASLPADLADADLDAVIEKVGIPAIVKPANGFGTSSTIKVASRADFESALQDLDYPPELRSRHLIAEEFIDGQEYHVDAIWRDGEAWFFAISRYFANRLDLAARDTKMDGSVVLAEAEHPELYHRMRELHQRVNGALDIRFGPTHLEVFIEHGSGRLVFSEIATRLSGGLVSEVLALAWGVDARAAAAHELVGGSLDDLGGHESYGHAGFLNLVPTRSGVVSEVPTRDDLLAHPNIRGASVLISAGDKVDLDERTVWLIMLVLAAESEDGVVRAAEEISREFRIVMAENLSPGQRRSPVTGRPGPDPWLARTRRPAVPAAALRTAREPQAGRARAVTFRISWKSFS
jgi:D-alanine-D-alanine ligase-like ATP-grasp enzyme